MTLSKTAVAAMPVGGKDLVVHDLPFELPFWVVSDTHFGHRNIIKYCGRPDDHERLMREAWADKVGFKDTIVHLGDLTLRKASELDRDKLHRLPGKKFLLKGNHDRRSRGRYAELGFTMIKKSFALPYKGWVIIFSHRPDVERQFMNAPFRINVHGHIHEKTIDDRRFINVSVEQTNYSPVWITDLLDERIAELSE